MSDIYAVNENTEIHFLLRNGRQPWAIVYVDGLMLDAKPRVH